MADPAKRGVALEEDDEFEEFQQEDWEPNLVSGTSVLPLRPVRAGQQPVCVPRCTCSVPFGYGPFV